MWNKILITLFIITGINIGAKAQKFLNMSRKDILHYIENNKINQLGFKEYEDSVFYSISEEDERNRRFEVAFRFLVSNESNSICTYYEKWVPDNEYYINTILEMVSLKKAKSDNVLLDINDERLYSSYDFGEYMLMLKQKDGLLILSFSAKSK